MIRTEVKREVNSLHANLGLGQKVVKTVKLFGIVVHRKIFHYSELEDYKDIILSQLKDKEKAIVYPNDKRCRYCKSNNIERIPRSGFVKFTLFWIPLRHYICYKCARKQYKLQKV